MIREDGNWVEYRSRFDLSETDIIDLHFGNRDRNILSYEEAMRDVYELVMASLRKAQENRRPYLMFNHGHSTSRPGKTTARSVVRECMRSRETTPLIVKAQCIQHGTVFIAKIRLPAPYVAVSESLGI